MTLIVSDGQLKSVSVGFLAVTRRLVICATAAVALVFAVGTHVLLDRQTRLAVVAEARLCASALTPGPNGDLTESVERLRSRHGRLVAVASLGPTGRVEAAYPSADRGFREAANTAAEARSEAVAVTAAGGGARHELWGVNLPLNGTESPASWRVVILLTRDRGYSVWLVATGVVAALAAVGLGLGAWGLSRWFEGNVTQPLRRIATSARNTRSTGGVRPSLRGNVWRETEDIAECLRRHVEQGQETQAYTKQVEYEAQQQVRLHQKRLDNRLRRAEDRATMDALTGLRNRHFLESELGPLFDRQRGARRDLAAVVFDVDNFKPLNDTRGHEAGDDILRFLGELLRAAIRPTDFAVRMGGDEFLLLLPDVNTRQANSIAERIVRLFAQYAGRLGQSPAVSLSAGIATLRSTEGADGGELLAAADAALYRAKGQGKNSVSTAEDAPIGPGR